MPGIAKNSKLYLEALFRNVHPKNGQILFSWLLTDHLSALHQTFIPTRRQIWGQHSIEVALALPTGPSGPLTDDKT